MMVDEELREQSKNVETEKLVSPTILPIRKQVLQMIAVCSLMFIILLCVCNIEPYKVLLTLFVHDHLLN
jgi:hypothetical protein